MMRVEGRSWERAARLLVVAMLASAPAACSTSTGQGEGPSPGASHGGADHDDHEEHEEHHEHGHEEDGHDTGSATLEQLEQRRCEHDRAILDCDDCRYEVGAVEVSPRLMSKEGDDLVRTAPVRSLAKQGRLVLAGEVSFDEGRVAHVSPRVEGMARQVFVSLGDRVAQGDRLVAMDSLELGRLRSEHLRATARLELARSSFERERRLHEKRIASGREKQLAETALREARIELEAAEEQLRLLGLGRGGSRGPGAGGQAIVRAPVAGTVVMLHAVRGERLAPDSALATVADLSKVWVWGHAYERDLAQLLAASSASKLPAEVTAEAFPGKAFEGVVDYVGAVMEESTRTVKVRVVVDNEGELLRPGMFVRAAVELGEAGAALMVPAEAVVEQEGRPFVFVKIGPSRFLRRDVRVGPVEDGLVPLYEGVDEGQEIVVRGAFLLKSDVLREQMGAGCAD